ncbi:MAG: 3-dehydroquinate synthase [Desulfotomaculum sp.]|nr:3-dehydroquinate synthase [Desulfotomaculum sp.]
MKTVLPVNLSGRSYEIIIGPGLLQHAGTFLQSLNTSKKVLLVSDSNVMGLYGKAVQGSLQKAGFTVVRAEVPGSEKAKSLEQAAGLYDIMFEAGLDRKSPVIALGGGVVGDLAGFAAATYMRGVPFIQVPTTLLAQVDSSVGGKVAVNHPRGKNIIGAFYQPRMVLTDTLTLSTLEKRELLSGLAEVIKAAVIKNAEFFNWLEENLEPVLRLEPPALKYVIETSCRIKAQVVEEDEKEEGVRAVLNFGHTVGHAVEVLAGYGEYRHGEAVAIGMAAEACLARELELVPDGVVQRIKKLLKRAGLPYQVPSQIAEEDILSRMYKDKKTQEGKLTFALICGIGKAVIKRNVPEDVVLKSLKQGGGSSE